MHRPPDDPNYTPAMEPQLSPKRTKPFSMTNEVRFSWLVAFGVLLTYVCLATFGAHSIMEIEKKKYKFQSVEVSKPISFFDRSYMVKEEIGPNGSPVHHKN